MPPRPWNPGLGNCSVTVKGETLRRARLAAGLTQRQLSALCAEAGTPVDFSNISKAENHDRGLGPRSLAVILRVLPGLNPGDFIPGIDDELRDLLTALTPEPKQAVA